MTTDRDPTIGALLDQIGEPSAPDPSFWTDLEDRLEHGGPRVVPLHPLPPRPTRRRVVAALVAAAVIAALVYGVATTSHDRAVPAYVGRPPAPAFSPIESLVSSTVTTWIDDLLQGNAQAAWDLVGPQSRSMVDEAAFDGMLADLKGTWSPWVGSAVVRHVLQLPAPHEELWVVSMRIDSLAEVQALLVRFTGPQVQVEPFLPGNALSLVSLPFDQRSAGHRLVPVAPSQEIQLHVEANAVSSLVAIDGVAVPSTSLRKDATGAIVGVTAPARVGPHDILVVEVLPDGTVALADQHFDVVPG